MTMFPSACAWLYETPVLAAFEEIKSMAFHYVDIETEALDAPGASDALKRLGLKVSCVALDHRLPPGCSLEGDDSGALRKAIEYLKQGLEKCSAVEARAAYVVSCRSPKHLKSFAVALNELADYAAKKGIKLCVEHAHGRALSTAKQALSFVDSSRESNLHLLLDTGHTLISGEKPEEIILVAGKKLGYIQMNDNDGKSDRHWALLDGRMGRDELARIIDALVQIGYDGTLGLEIKNDRASVGGGLSRNRNLLLRMQISEEAKSLKEPETRRKK